MQDKTPHCGPPNEEKGVSVPKVRTPCVRHWRPSRALWSPLKLIHLTPTDLLPPHYPL